MTVLLDAARQVLDTQAALHRPYVPTASNSKSPRDVTAGRHRRASDAIAALAVAVAAEQIAQAAARHPCAWDDGTVVHRLRGDFRTACKGSTEPVQDYFTRQGRGRLTAEVLTADRACPDCDWGL